MDLRMGKEELVSPKLFLKYLETASAGDRKEGIRMKLFDRISGLIGIIAAVAMIVIVAFFAREWGQTEGQLTEVRGDLHFCRVLSPPESPFKWDLKEDTARWALEEYDTVMGFLERLGTEDGFYVYDNLSQGPLPLLRYIVDASWYDYVTPAEAEEAITRMEQYLENQPGPDIPSKQELNKIKAHVW